MLKSKIENKALRTTYYRQKSSDVWHWHPSCPYFQELEKDEESIRVIAPSRPPSNKFCKLCDSKDRREREA